VSTFLAHYGPESLFVRATSDVLTRALADMMRAKGLLKNERTVASIAPPIAVEALNELLATVPGGHRTLYDDALGYGPAGEVARLVDANQGSGSFLRWSTAFESGDFSAASRMLHAPDEPGS